MNGKNNVKMVRFLGGLDLRLNLEQTPNNTHQKTLIIETSRLLIVQTPFVYQHFFKSY